MSRTPHVSRPHPWRWRALLLASAAILSAVPAQAQDSPAQDAPVTARDEVRLPPLTLLPPVNTTGLRNERRLMDTPATVDVIPGAELDRQMVRNAEDVFRYTPGITVNRQTTGTDPFASLGGITVRGVGGNRVLTVVDGFRTIERITDNTRDVVDPWNLSRVEVVRGPGSVLYGSDALGGVVNYITRNPSDYIRPGETWGGEASTSFGSVDNSLQSRLTVAAQAAEFSAMFSYQRRDASEPSRNNSRSPDGIWNCTRNLSFGATPCNQFNPTDVAADNYFARVVWDPLPNFRLRVTADVLQRATDVDQRYDLGPASGGITNLDYHRRQAIQRGLFSTDAEWRPEYGWLDSLRVMAGYSPQEIERTGTRLRQLANGQRTSTYDRLTYSENVLQGEIQLGSSFNLLGTRHVLTYGVSASTTETDYEREDIATNLNTGVRTVTRAGGFNFSNADTRRIDGFAQDEITLFGGRLTLVPGLRYSTTRISPRPDGDYKPVAGAEPRVQDDSNVSLGLGAIWRLDEVFSLYANYGEGFKQPTAEQLYTSLPSTTFNLVPNPGLRPEEVTSVEGGIRMQLPNAYASLGVFRADYTDFIQSFVSIPGTIDITYQNLSEVTVQGVEFAGGWRFARDWTLNGAASWQEGTQRATPGAARTAFDGARPLTATAGVTYDNRDLRTSVTLNGTYAAEVTEASSSQLYMPKSYQVFDLLASWRPLPNLELNGGIFNLLDTRYLPLSPGGTTYNRSEFASDATKAANPIELQVAPGRNFRIGARITF
ncbi:TonB-dependent hemoglobin/transferrin/lactoferrin family receptor [Roseomonas frigidaquae]|uniref:TonB-dependent hemoglobin/transferrin/lactoferrin family receptor n=1 Tax=Falsiroseomonas frigidaquae TaxID=487318 RepID=A0ABX1F1G0_9PROT|nr:TonB-dependent hemoglobin/transferrin/lactoferrin family receptor [Falsiroseomonas frigidaquae]NKE46181.1 TonB-dependent hemoglobin/transferrin/lactoferrin family receptor [Falsiroseomonas frigidaquae]